MSNRRIKVTLTYIEILRMLRVNIPGARIVGISSSPERATAQITMELPDTVVSIPGRGVETDTFWEPGQYAREVNLSDVSEAV